MKRFLSFLLILVLFLSSVPTSVWAEEVSASTEEIVEEYFSIPVEYSDDLGIIQHLDVMIRGENVYANAEMLSLYLRYSFVDSGEYATLIMMPSEVGRAGNRVIEFKYDDTDVVFRMGLLEERNYTAPFATIRNEHGTWIPFEYGLAMMSSGMMILEDAISIDMPRKNLVDYFYDIQAGYNRFPFRWEHDFGYTEETQGVLGASAHMVNVFSGMISLDGASWKAAFQQVVGSNAAYEKKYGEQLALLMCTQSEREVEAMVQNLEMVVDMMSKNGKLGETLSDVSKTLDDDVGAWFDKCEELKKHIQGNNGALLEYNKSYQAMESALDRQSWFSATGGTILDVQSRFDEAVGRTFDFLNVCSKLVEVCGFMEDYSSQDAFSLETLIHYLETETNGLESTRNVKKGMLDYANSLSGSLFAFTAKQVSKVVDDWLLDEVPLHRIVGTPAALVLIAWDISSGTIPFLKDGLASADSFELALSAIMFQNDAYNNYQSDDFSKFTAEDLYARAQYAYIYLKACYIAREAAVASLVGESKPTGTVKHIVEQMGYINRDIAKIIVALKEANPTNDGGVFGFLPADNVTYLREYDDSRLIEWIRLLNAVSDAYNENINGTMVQIPGINLPGDEIAKINEEIWNDLYCGVVEKCRQWWEAYPGSQYQYVKYDWNVRDGVISIVVESRESHSAAQWDYYVYNVSASKKEKLAVDEMIAVAGLSREEYETKVRVTLGAYLFEDLENHIKNNGHTDAYSYKYNRKDRFEEVVESTVSEENIQRCLPYFDENGDLCVIASIYQMAGPEENSYRIKLEDHPAGEEAFTRYVKIMEEAEGSTDYRKQYKATLLKYPEYVTHVNVRYSDGKTIYTNTETLYGIYDINKDGTPELIVNKDTRYYYVHSLVGTEVVKVGEFYNNYSALYEYAGNGFISHSGGTGTMRIEHITVYSMDGTVLIEGEPEYTSDIRELHSKLDGMTPIDVKCPVRDFSLLGG